MAKQTKKAKKVMTGTVLEVIKYKGQKYGCAGHTSKKNKTTVTCRKLPHNAVVDSDGKILIPPPESAKCKNAEGGIAVSYAGHDFFCRGKLVGGKTEIKCGPKRGPVVEKGSPIEVTLPPAGAFVQFKGKRFFCHGFGGKTSPRVTCKSAPIPQAKAGGAASWLAPGEKMSPEIIEAIAAEEGGFDGLGRYSRRRWNGLDGLDGRYRRRSRRY